MDQIKSTFNSLTGTGDTTNTAEQAHKSQDPSMPAEQNDNSSLGEGKADQIDQANDEQISEFIRDKYKSSAGNETPTNDK